MASQQTIEIVGKAYLHRSNSTWSVTRNSSTAESVFDMLYGASNAETDRTSSNYVIERATAAFDFTEIYLPKNTEIQSAILKMIIKPYSQIASYPIRAYIQELPAPNDPWTVSDYSGFGSLIDYVDFDPTIGGGGGFTETEGELDVTDYVNDNLTEDYIGFMFREQRDYENSAPPEDEIRILYDIETEILLTFIKKPNIIMMAM